MSEIGTKRRLRAKGAFRRKEFASIAKLFY
jgi:hypothetical protein